MPSGKEILWLLTNSMACTLKMKNVPICPSVICSTVYTILDWGRVFPVVHQNISWLTYVRNNSAKRWTNKIFMHLKCNSAIIPNNLQKNLIGEQEMLSWWISCTVYKYHIRYAYFHFLNIFLSQVFIFLLIIYLITPLYSNFYYWRKYMNKTNMKP